MQASLGERGDGERHLVLRTDRRPPSPSGARVLDHQGIESGSSLRTIDRARIRLGLPDRDLARYRADVLEAIRAFSLIAVNSIVLDRASEPFPTALGSLDAIHLASALLARDQIDGLVFATHDDELGTAARATGFEVHGLKRGV